MSYFTQYFDDLTESIKHVDETLLLHSAELVQKVKDSNAKIIIAGNGGSAAMASHVSVDFTKAAKVRAVNFNEADLITCFGNDYGYENWIKEALIAYSDPGDLLILVSSSGQSANIINAAKESSRLGLDLITLSGFEENNPLRELGAVNFWINSSNYNYVEMTHHIWLLAICDFVITNNS